MSGEQDDQSPQVNQEATSKRDNFVAGRDVNITVTFRNGEEAAEVLAGFSSAARAARSIAEAGMPVPPGAQNGPGAIPGTSREGLSRREAIPRPPAFPGDGSPAGDKAAIAPPTRIPWTPLATVPVVTWVDAGSRVTGDPEKCHVELHIVPASPSSASARLIAPTLLVDVGRQAGLFPSSATVITQLSGDLVSALLADPVEQAETVVAGLRAFRNGQRSGWLTLPRGQQRTGDVPLGPMAEQALAMLLAATVSVRRSRSDQVAVAVAVDAGPGASLFAAPRDWLPAHYLVSHPRQVAADLMGQLAGPGR